MKKCSESAETELDFTKQSSSHCCYFVQGDNLAAHFLGRSQLVRPGDTVLVKMESGKIGRYELYSVIRVSIGGKYRAIGKLLGYKTLAQEATSAKEVDVQVQARSLAGKSPSRFDSANRWP